MVNSYRNTISKWAVGFRYGNFFIPWVEKIPIPETRPIPKSYIYLSYLFKFTFEKQYLWRLLKNQFLKNITSLQFQRTYYWYCNVKTRKNSIFDFRIAPIRNSTTWSLLTKREVICEVASQCFLQFPSASSQKPLVTHKFSSKGS